MADDVRTVLKNFNQLLLTEELAASALPFESVFLAGFISAGRFEVQPSPTPRLIFRDKVAGIEDFADPGEIRFVFTVALTVPEGVVLDDLLAAHGSTGLTTEQQRQQQDIDDLDFLEAQWPNYDSFNQVEFDEFVKRLSRSYIRDQRNSLF